MLRLENVAMRYGTGPEVLTEVNLSLGRGDFFFVMGPSGAGKTSLLRVLGLIAPTSRGRVLMFDRDVRSLDRQELAALRRRIGIVFQDFRLLDHLSSFDNVALPLRIHGGQDDQIRDFVIEMLTWLGLEDLVDSDPTTLSMGQRQMVAIARAVVTRPNLLLCDEPTSNIDGRLARRLMHLFSQLSKLGTSVVISTHNDELVARHPHPVLHMSRGRLASPLPGPASLAAAG
jgi:cell division transport system ATP-binding protein